MVIMNPMDLSWRLLKKQYVPEWHLKQRFPKGKPITEVKPWKRMPRPPKARTTHGFQGEPIPTNEEILDNPPVAVPDVTEHTDEEWRKKIRMRMADDENAEVVPEFSPEFQRFWTGEPMDLSWRLLKDRQSPEAFRHKKEYDTQYESSPSRHKYRAELARERRKKGVMGHGGADMSHTRQHTIVPEDPHSNRARHFKERGTLKAEEPIERETLREVKALRRDVKKVIPPRHTPQKKDS